jgi:hypothetical protein
MVIAARCGGKGVARKNADGPLPRFDPSTVPCTPRDELCAPRRLACMDTGIARGDLAMGDAPCLEPNHEGQKKAHTFPVCARVKKLLHSKYHLTP